MTWRPRPETVALDGRAPPVRVPGDLEGYLLPSYVALRAARARLTQEAAERAAKLPPEERKKRRREAPVFAQFTRRSDAQERSDAAWAAFMATPEGRRGQLLARAALADHLAKHPPSAELGAEVRRGLREEGR